MDEIKTFEAPNVSMLLGAYTSSFDENEAPVYRVDGSTPQPPPVVDNGISTKTVIKVLAVYFGIVLLMKILT